MFLFMNVFLSKVGNTDLSVVTECHKPRIDDKTASESASERAPEMIWVADTKYQKYKS